jgi:hypothetical protein
MSDFLRAGWVEDASADNATATATKAAVSTKQHIIFGVTASFSAAATKLLTVKDGNTTIMERTIYSAADLTFPRGIAATKGNAVSAILTASGSGGVIGYVALHGITL